MDLKKLETRLPKVVFDQIPSVIETFKINTPLRLAHFLAQCAHESGNFKATVENLNYSATSLRAVFGKYFPDDATAKLYERKPEKIANIVYASRMGNGGKASGEGWKYRGRGYIQLTGKTNYAAFDKSVPEDIIASPELVATKYPLLSAAWFWNSRNLNSLADNGKSDAVVTQITKKINGGTHGLADRLAKFKLFISEIS
jgi:putative chitinase